MWSFIATQPRWLKVTFWSLSSKTPTLFKSVPFLYYPKKVAELHGSDDSRSKLEDAKTTLLIPSHLQTNKKLRFACWMLGKSSKDILPNGGFISNLQWHKVNNHQKNKYQENLIGCFSLRVLSFFRHKHIVVSEISNSFNVISDVSPHLLVAQTFQART